jgi:hypothetical protein
MPGMSDRGIVKAALQKPIVVNALRVSLLIGTILNAINNGETLVTGGDLPWLKVLMNYLVPYCVASYSGAKALMITQSIKP